MLKDMNLKGMVEATWGRNPWRVLMPRKAETKQAARLLLDSLLSTPSKAAALVASSEARGAETSGRLRP